MANLKKIVWEEKAFLVRPNEYQHAYLQFTNKWKISNHISLGLAVVNDLETHIANTGDFFEEWNRINPQTRIRKGS